MPDTFQNSIFSLDLYHLIFWILMEYLFVESILFIIDQLYFKVLFQIHLPFIDQGSYMVSDVL